MSGVRPAEAAAEIGNQEENLGLRALKGAPLNWVAVKELKLSYHSLESRNHFIYYISIL